MASSGIGTGIVPTGTLESPIGYESFLRHRTRPDVSLGLS